LLAEWPTMPATVIAERIGWTRSLTVCPARRPRRGAGLRWRCARSRPRLDAGGVAGLPSEQATRVRAHAAEPVPALDDKVPAALAEHRLSVEDPDLKVDL
jgi:hypothetical protein